MDPRGGKAGPFDGEENPQDRQNLELDPLGGTTLRCWSCLDWGASQVQPQIDCHQKKDSHGNDGDENDEDSDADDNDDNVANDEVEVTWPLQVREELARSLLVLEVVVMTTLIVIVDVMMINEYDD